MNHQGQADEQSHPAPLQDNNRRDPVRNRAANYEKEERSVRSVRSVSKIVVKGSMDVVFFRTLSAHLVAAEESQESIRNIKTRFEDEKCAIEQEVPPSVGSGSPCRELLEGAP